MTAIPEAWAPYIAGLKKRAAAEREALRVRKERAHILSKQAADLLRERFGASRVVLFGSLTREDFTEWSDVDIAVWGVSADIWKAMGAVEDIAIKEQRTTGLDYIELNLVDMASKVWPAIVGEIEQTGVAL